DGHPVLARERAIVLVLGRQLVRPADDVTGSGPPRGVVLRPEVDVPLGKGLALVFHRPGDWITGAESIAAAAEDRKEAEARKQACRDSAHKPLHGRLIPSQEYDSAPQANIEVPNDRLGGGQAPEATARRTFVQYESALRTSPPLRLPRAQ